uniref:Cuticular protein R&R 1 n=1 Tax=Apis cerana cerana TaxID=94128 RepID=A0A023GZ26_APICC|nr:cuticular protein R&R 1 [Apis cerana cerana]AFV27513.1 cuticular protein R&R 1 [Apis cerana cerana]
MENLIIAFILISPCLGNISHLLSESSTTTTPSSPHKPYSFHYQAGRYPGNIDRVHQENGDGTGHIRGSYSFIDPKHKIRTVQYTADENGFHASLINYEDTVVQPIDSETVRLAKEKHFRLYQKIAEANAHGVPINLPQDSASVERAKDKHIQLYQKIAEEHAAIAAQRETERLAYEATSIVNDVNLDHAY